MCNRGSTWNLILVPFGPGLQTRAMRSGREQFVTLPAKIPVTIAYFTAWVDAEGAVRFAPDVYRHDLFHDKVLPAPRSTSTVAVARS